MSKQINVKVGLLANRPGLDGSKGSDEVSENLDIAGLGAVHEYGANINHPGGTPYFINEWGMATFVKKDSILGQKLIAKGQVTQPHEISIPARSWLQMPLQRNNGADFRAKVTETLKSWGPGFTKAEILESLIERNDLASLGVAIGAAAQEQILEAFETEGFGEWLPDKSTTIARKHSAMPLIDNGHLKGAVTFEVEENNG